MKRIDSISTSKLNKIEEEYKGKIKFKTGSSSNLDIEAAEGILAGDVRLRTTEELLGVIAAEVEKYKQIKEEEKIARAANRHYGYRSNCITLNTFDFVNREDVKKYHDASNAVAKRLDTEKKDRRKKVVAEASKIKDEVMFEGSDKAVALLEKFANKKF